MGGCTSITMEAHKNKSSDLLVATLNYGGILNSPFEFYSNQQDEEKVISQHFRDLIAHSYPDFDPKTFSWKIGKIDQKIQKQRYTPIYSPTAGVQNGKLISAERFQQLWNEHFSKALLKVKLQKQPTKEEIEFMRTFDLLCYHALLRHAYKIKSITEIENKDADRYNQLMKKFFSRSYLDEDKKLKLLLTLLNDQNIHVGVFFFQQPTPALAKCLKDQGKFKIFEGGPDESMIVIREDSQIGKKAQSFEEVKKNSNLSPQDIKKVQANPQTRIVMSGNIFFVCVHLSSKAEKNKKELEELKEGIRILMEAFPNHEFIIGGDTNVFVKQNQIQDEKTAKKISIFPSDPKAITTCKTRTCMQPQFNKADKIAQECKDQLMSTLKMEQARIITIDHKSHQSTINLPTESHPFDHMLVYSIYYLPKASNK